MNGTMTCTCSQQNQVCNICHVTKAEEYRKRKELVKTPFWKKLTTFITKILKK